MLKLQLVGTNGSCELRLFDRLRHDQLGVLQAEVVQEGLAGLAEAKVGKALDLGGSNPIDVLSWGELENRALDFGRRHKATWRRFDDLLDAEEALHRHR